MKSCFEDATPECRAGAVRAALDAAKKRTSFACCKVTCPVKNMRWNESPVFALNNLDAMTAPERVVSGEGVGGAGFSIVCPAARIRQCTFTSGSDAV